MYNEVVKQLNLSDQKESLLPWYDHVKRDLPWRVEITAYKIWISEVMLQQTQVVTVIAYFNRFMNRFPDVFALAKADESEVFKHWEGLGYYSRARNLIKCARLLVASYDGEFPKTAKELERLPGIGPYTAAAIASIAFNEMVAVVDGNVYRVLSRRYGIERPINQPKNASFFRECASDLMKETMHLFPDRLPGDFNQAMMELGATVCTPKNANCSQCPFNRNCIAYKENRVADFPVKIAKQEKKNINVAMMILIHKEEVFLMKKSESGLLSDLWGFPYLDLEAYRVDENLSDAVEDLELVKLWIQDQLGLQVDIKTMLQGVKHVFTHRVWHVKLFFMWTNERVMIDYPQTQWMPWDKLKKNEDVLLDTTALATAFTKQFAKVDAVIEANK